MKWTSPTRENQALPIIPNEIYLEILDYVSQSVDWTGGDRRRALSSLSQVCRFFWAFVVPQLFKSLEIFGDSTNQEPRSSINAVTFCRAINNRQEPAASLACHVKKCTFVKWPSEPATFSSASAASINAAFVAMYCRALLRMSNLNTFTLQNVSISRRLLKTICKTKALRSLTLGNSRFAEDITENFPTKTPPLTSLAIMEFSDTPEFPDSFASVVARVVTAEDLKSITAPNFDLISTLLPQTTALVELILTDMVCSRATWDAIGSLQALRTLEIERFAVEAADQEHPSRQAQLATSHLPNLQRLKGPLSFSYIVANRPISSLDLTGTVRLKDRQALVSFTSAPVDFPLIVQSSADIVSLFIHYNVYTEPVCGKLSAVQTLKLKCTDKDIFKSEHSTHTFAEQLTFFIDDIATQRAPVLSVLSLNFHFGVDVTWPACHYYDLELQRTLIPRITAGFPNLRKIQFFYYIEWSKPLNEDRWTGYIPLELYPILHLLLRKIGTTYKDVDGLLNAVIDTDSFGTL